MPNMGESHLAGEVLTIQSYATTPQRAVLQIAYSEPKKRPVIRRVNVAGSFATVLISGGRLEARHLPRRFSYSIFPLDGSRWMR